MRGFALIAIYLDRRGLQIRLATPPKCGVNSVSKMIHGARAFDIKLLTLVVQSAILYIYEKLNDATKSAYRRSSRWWHYLVRVF